MELPDDVCGVVVTPLAQWLTDTGILRFVPAVAPSGTPVRAHLPAPSRAAQPLAPDPVHGAENGGRERHEGARPPGNSRGHTLAALKAARQQMPSVLPVLPTARRADRLASVPATHIGDAVELVSGPVHGKGVAAGRVDEGGRALQSDGMRATAHALLCVSLAGLAEHLGVEGVHVHHPKRHMPAGARSQPAGMRSGAVSEETSRGPWTVSPPAAFEHDNLRVRCSPRAHTLGHWIRSTTTSWLAYGPRQRAVRYQVFDGTRALRQCRG